MATETGKVGRRLSNFETALRAERKKVVRGFQPYTSEQRANHAASFRLGHRQRVSLGEAFYTHPDVPRICFPTRIAAARYALSRAEQVQGGGNG